MKIQSAITKSIGTAILFAVVSSGQNIQTDYDRGVDFRQYKTYSWQKVQTQNPLWADRIKDAVNAELARKGWTPVESGGDVSIISIEMTHTQRTLNTFYQGFGGGWGWGRG